jgi:hypothetical protein
MKKSSRSKTTNRRETKIDPTKIFTPEILRTNLLVSSLYLTSYEILKIAINEGVKNFFIFQSPISDEDEKELLKSVDPKLVERFRESYQKEVSEYEKEVGISIDDREKLGLIPSCKWLQRQNALSEAEVDEIRKIRDHRNEIAHELPALLTGEGFDIQLEHFQRIRILIHKIDVFWARNDVLFDANTLDEVNMQDVPDDEIVSGRDAMLTLITNTVIDYLNEIMQSKSSD